MLNQSDHINSCLYYIIIFSIWINTAIKRYGFHINGFFYDVLFNIFIPCKYRYIKILNVHLDNEISVFFISCLCELSIKYQLLHFNLFCLWPIVQYLHECWRSFIVFSHYYVINMINNILSIQICPYFENDWCLQFLIKQLI